MLIYCILIKINTCGPNHDMSVRLLDLGYYCYSRKNINFGKIGLFDKKVNFGSKGYLGNFGSKGYFGLLVKLGKKGILVIWVILCNKGILVKLYLRVFW